MRRLVTTLIVIALLTAPVAALDAAKGSVVLEPDSGRVLYENNADQKLGMASTTKILTALITLEQPDIDAPFVVDADAIRVEGSSMGLVEGDVVTLRALAWGMLMHSGNDAANAAAVAIAGDIGGFAALMNGRAAAIGMANSHFTNPSGLSDDDHYSTAYDMALLAAEALKNPDFATMASSKNATVSFGNPPYDRLMINHNRLLWRYDYAIGVKTGFTKAAGRCLVSAAYMNGVTLICVTLSCPDDFNAHRNAYVDIFETIGRVDFSDEVTELSLPVVGGLGSTVALELATPLEASLFPDEVNASRVIVEVPHFVYAPICAGDYVGTASVYLAGELVAQSHIVAAEDVLPIPDPPTLLERLFGKKQ